MSQRIPVLITMGDGTQHEVVVDQRDFAAAEAKELFSDTRMPATRTRFMAWNAARREGVYKGTWEKFNTADCQEADAADPEGDDDGLDPGRPAPSAGD